MLSCICIQQYAAMHCLLSQNQSQHFSCFFATNQMIYSANHHVSHACTVVQCNVVRAILLSYGKPSTLTIYSSKTPERMKVKFSTIDYVVEISECDEIHLCWFRRATPTHTWNISSKSFFFIFFSRFSDSRTGRTGPRKSVSYGLKDAV